MSDLTDVHIRIDISGVFWIFCMLFIFEHFLVTMFRRHYQSIAWKDSSLECVKREVV